MIDWQIYIEFKDIVALLNYNYYYTRTILYYSVDAYQH